MKELGRIRYEFPVLSKSIETETDVFYGRLKQVPRGRSLNKLELELDF